MSVKDLAIQIDGLIIAADGLVYLVQSNVMGKSLESRDIAGLITVIDLLREKSQMLLSNIGD